MFFTLLVSVVVSAAVSAIVNAYFPGKVESVDNSSTHTNNYYGHPAALTAADTIVDNAPSALSTLSKPAALPAPSAAPSSASAPTITDSGLPYRMYYAKKQWKVKNSLGAIVARFDSKPTADVVRAAGYADGDPVSVAAADYRERVNDRCDTKGYSLQYA